MNNVALPINAAVPADVSGVIVRAGGHVGGVRVGACDAARVEVSLPGELGWGRAMVGVVPIVWCAAAWLVCLRERVLAERLNGCVALSIMAVASAGLMMSSIGARWRFDGRRGRVGRRVGLLGRSFPARQFAGLRVATTAPSARTTVRLRMTLVDVKGVEQFEVAAWDRREIDRAQVEALAAAIRRTMGWVEGR